MRKFTVPGDLVIGGLLGAGTAWCMLQDTVGYSLLAKDSENALRFCHYKEITLLTAALAWFVWTGWQADRKQAGRLGRWVGLPLLASAVIVLMAIAFMPSTRDLLHWADNPVGWALLIVTALVKGIPTAAIAFGLVAFLHERRILHVPVLGSLGTANIASWLGRATILGLVMAGFYVKTEVLDSRLWRYDYPPHCLLTDCVVYLTWTEHLCFLLAVLVPAGCLVGCATRHLRGAAVKLWPAALAVATPLVAMAAVSNLLAIGTTQFVWQPQGVVTVVRPFCPSPDRVCVYPSYRLTTTSIASFGTHRLTEPKLMHGIADIVNANMDGHPIEAVHVFAGLLATAGPDAPLRWTAYNSRYGPWHRFNMDEVDWLAARLHLKAGDPDYSILLTAAEKIGSPSHDCFPIERRHGHIHVDGCPMANLAVSPYYRWDSPGDFDLQQYLAFPDRLLSQVVPGTTTDGQGEFELARGYFDIIAIRFRGNVSNVAIELPTSATDIGTIDITTH